MIVRKVFGVKKDGTTRMMRTFIGLFLTDYYIGYLVKEDQIVGTCSTCRCMQGSDGET